MLGLLYYSNTCNYCYKLMTVMNNQGILQMFEGHNVDDISFDKLAQLGITQVPTIVINHIQNGQSIRGLHEKEKAFNWVENVIKNRRQMMDLQAENSRKLIQLNAIKERHKDQLFEYNPAEAQGISDSYAYWRDDIEKDIQHAQPKSYMPYNQDEKYQVITVTLEDKENKINKNQMKKLVDTMINSRTNQTNEFINTMERKQIETIINSNFSNNTN